WFSCARWQHAAVGSIPGVFGPVLVDNSALHFGASLPWHHARGSEGEVAAAGHATRHFVSALA
ncbi:hypothetical protein, partial [Trinickia sp.]|uniref:hypothetical protein n=1 Tax=Trinickia sp. TaxID=2571163 RepID=UPI003F812117